MSGIYIKGMEMPEEGWHKVIRIFPDGTVVNYYNSITLGKAIPVPPHGRLIDADALERDIDKYIGGEESRSRFHHWVQVQDAVIPMDKGEEK